MFKSLSMMENLKKWYAVYTKPRWEKKVDQLLSQKGIESYCPMNKVKRQWSDRVRLVNEPLFKSYVFVRISDEKKGFVRSINGVINFVYWLGKPAIIKGVEIERIRKFMDEYDHVELCPLKFTPNDRVLIHSGALMDKEATVKRVLNKKVEVIVEGIGYKLVAYVEKNKMAFVVKPIAKS